MLSYFLSCCGYSSTREIVSIFQMENNNGQLYAKEISLVSTFNTYIISPELYQDMYECESKTFSSKTFTEKEINSFKDRSVKQVVKTLNTYLYGSTRNIQKNMIDEIDILGTKIHNKCATAKTDEVLFSYKVDIWMLHKLKKLIVELETLKKRYEHIVSLEYYIANYWNMGSIV